MKVDRGADARIMEETLALAREVKAFAKTVGIEPSDALLQTSEAKPAASMLWIWLQRLGTIAVDTPLDVRVAIKFSLPKEQLPLDQVYRAAGYSHYFRQGNQFGDEGSVITLDFAKEKITTQVKIIIHEDLHEAKNFDLAWEVEESLITPLGMVAALEFFQQSNAEAVNELNRLIDEERRLSRDISDIVGQAQKAFQEGPLTESREKIGKLIASYPVYDRYFRFHLEGQDTDLALEAKLSHDLAYYRYYERLVSLYESMRDLRLLVQELKKIPREADARFVGEYLDGLAKKYGKE
jgi:hypothetical protein